MHDILSELMVIQDTTGFTCVSQVRLGVHGTRTKKIYILNYCEKIAPTGASSLEYYNGLRSVSGGYRLEWRIERQSFTFTQLPLGTSYRFPDVRLSIPDPSLSNSQQMVCMHARKMSY